MNMDCQWISENLEALFCDGLTPEQDRHARAHIEGCAACRSEVEALRAIDPLVKSHFQRQLAIASAPRRARMSGANASPSGRSQEGMSGANASPSGRSREGMSGANASPSGRSREGTSLVYAGAAAAALVVLALVARTPSTTPHVPAPLPQAQVEPAAPVEAPPPAKTDSATDAVRAKPALAAPAAAAPAAVVAVEANAPDFLVTDPAGYSRTLDDYRGRTLLVGVWSNSQPQAAANLERLYETFGASTKLRFLGVSKERQDKPAGTTFPVAYNQGSRLFNAGPGTFVLLDPSGKVRSRGSLVTPFDDLVKSLRPDLEALGAR